MNAEELGSVLIALPPLAQQAEIVQLLDQETARIDGLIAKLEEGIERLKEYRTAVISAAVTGRIDVRGDRDGSALAEVEAGRVSA